MAGRKGNRQRQKRIREIRRRVLIFTGAAVAIAYIAGIIVLYGRFLENTSVNGVDVSRLNAEEAETLYRETWDGWQLTVTTLEGNEEIIDGDAIGYELKMKPSFPSMVRWQNYLKWPFTRYLKTNIKPKSSAAFDEEKLRQAIAALDCVSGDEIRDPVNAHIGRAEDGGYYELVEADNGNRLNDERTYEAISQAILTGETRINLAEAGCYEKATVFADDETLRKQFAPVDNFQQTVISIDMAGGITEYLTKEIYGSWLEYDAEKASITVSSDKAYEYVVSLYDRYSTYGHERKLRAHAGDVVEVGGSKYDNFGYDMDLETTAATIRDALITGVSQEVSCTWNKKGRERNELGSDFGSTYVEISLDEQRLWYYIDGEVTVSTSIVSGLATRSRATPTGCFQVLDLLTDHDMQGSYGTAHASYVIAIMFNGICIHDSSWRDEYGGDIWLDDGSHGCINTPYTAAKELYETISYGVPVVIYDRADTVPDVQNELYTGTDSEIVQGYQDSGGEEYDESEWE